MRMQSTIQSSSDTMQNITVNILKAALILFILTAIGVKLMDYHSLLPLILLAVIMTIGTILMILHMASSGKVRAKGAKRRRKRLLPFIYDRKKASRVESINRSMQERRNNAPIRD